jgi:hypothetical protein
LGIRREKRRRSTVEPCFHRAGSSVDLKDRVELVGLSGGRRLDVHDLVTHALQRDVLADG